jgi:hypothetical protein
VAKVYEVMAWRGSKLVEVYSLALPGLLRIQALNGVRYQLVDAQTGVAPSNGLMRRRGKSLIIDFMEINICI